MSLKEGVPWRDAWQKTSSRRGEEEKRKSTFERDEIAAQRKYKSNLAEQKPEPVRKQTKQNLLTKQGEIKKKNK